VGIRNDPLPGNAERSSGIGSPDGSAPQVISEFFNLPVQAYIGNFGIAFIVIAGIQAFPPGIPDKIGNIPVQGKGDFPFMHATGIHKVEFIYLVGLHFVVKTQVCNVFAIGRYCRRFIGTISVSKRLNRTIGHLHGVNFAIAEIVFPVGIPVGRNIQGSGVSRPGKGAVMIKIA